MEVSLQVLLTKRIFPFQPQFYQKYSKKAILKSPIYSKLVLYEPYF